MNGDAKRLLKYMAGDDKRFIIPVYQRNYDWKTENCKQLFDDLERCIRMNRKTHFFGSIVAAHDDEGALSEYLVIDGQQRLTTISLLLLAICRYLDKGKITSEDSQLRAKIYETYLVDKWQPKDKRLKLKPIKDDQRAYNTLYNDSEDNVSESTLTANYEYFCERILNTTLTADELFEAIRRLEIIDISLNRDDDPQLIFESLNSTGLDLSEGDKIRNYVLMGLPKEKQEEYYEKYWNPIEINSSYHVDAFVRDFLSLRRLRVPNIGKVYPAFKDYLEDKQIIDIEPVLDDLKKYSARYKVLLNGNGKGNELDWCIFRLNKLETNVTRPFFLEILRLFDEERITEDEATAIFKTVETYVFRRIICDVPTNALNKIFVSLHNDILRFDGTTDDYVAKMKYAFSSKRESGRFPSDEEFRENLGARNVYRMRAKNVKYFFERLENSGTKETKDVWNHLEQGTYSVEHIMPQSLTDKWRNDLRQDGDPEEIHENWLHKAANLTLTGYNSAYSNSAFTDKRDMDGGFKQSGLRMNQWIGNQERWGLPQMEERNRILLDQAIEIWPYPISDYIPQQKQDEFVTLDDDIEFTGLNISKYTFRGAEQTVSSWADMYQQVLISLHSENKAILRKLAYSGTQELPYTSFAVTDEAFNASKKIDDDIYVWTHNNTETKINVLRQIFPLYGESESDLVFYIRNTDESSDDSVADRYKLRKEFWSYALPYLQDAFKPNGPYTNVNPSKENWISGFIGINGISINCVIRYDSARVEYYILKEDEAETKALFDNIHSHKEEIETALGRPLEWDRGNEKKSSKISITMREVSLTDTADWDKIKDFMVSNSKAMHQTITGILK